MKTESEKLWQPLSPPALPAPAFALASGSDGLWAGGIGGIARYTATGDHAAWQPAQAILPLLSVTALLALDGTLLIGGGEGLAWSSTRGKSWQRADLEDGTVAVTALAASPNFARDRTALAATLDNGVVRTNNGGRTWTNASFGLESLEASALAWLDETTVLLATSDGLYRSRDAGRGWRRLYETEDEPVEALISLPDGTLLAALAGGSLLRSLDSGKRWSLETPLARPVQVLSLFATATGTLLLGTLEQGLLRSEDGGASWQTALTQAVHVCVKQGEMIYAGTDAGVCSSSDDGQSWRELPWPPLHDLRSLVTCGEELLLVGSYAGVLQMMPTGWQSFEDIPAPLTTCTSASDDALLLSGPTGLHHLSLNDGALRPLIEGEEGQVAHITRRAEHIWAASSNGSSLLHSADNGASWQQLPTPFGILPLAALQAASDRLLAATYDPRQYRVCLWHSSDDGVTWGRGLEAGTTWPLVASCSRPAAFSIGNVLFLEQASGQWQNMTIGQESGAIRRVSSVRLANTETLFLLTTTGIYWSRNMGQSWQREHDGLPVEQIIDMAVTDSTLFVLLTGGRVWQRDLHVLYSPALSGKN